MAEEKEVLGQVAEHENTVAMDRYDTTMAKKKGRQEATSSVSAIARCRCPRLRPDHVPFVSFFVWFSFLVFVFSIFCFHFLSFNFLFDWFQLVSIVFNFCMQHQ